MRICSKIAVLAVASLWMGFCVSSAFAQSTNAELSGRITDPNGLPVPKVKIEAVNVLTNVSTSTETNEGGIYVIPSLQPAIYRILVEKEGFDLIVKPNVELHVQDHGVLNFQLRVGSIATTVTVEGGAPLINTQDAAVSTVVDRQFAENLPMNGRSFQTLIQLTPGVVLTPTNATDTGQFSVNGQRAVSNYWMVDGVGANVGTTGVAGGNGFAGALGSFSALGGTNSLVSVDAMQEFRIQTSTYAPEFGRTPGAQISIVTRSGTNQFHGTLFDYFRNDLLDANDWFANQAGLPKPQERQNDFGGTFSGPILRDRTFFFFSYEGLRLRLPQVAQSFVPDLSARQNALPARQPYLNAFPLPTLGAPDNLATGVAQFNSSFSNRSSLDAYSLRADHKLTAALSIFGRYNYSPSSLVSRGANGTTLNVMFPNEITTQTATIGATWLMSPALVNDARFNYSRTNGFSHYNVDGFGGAVPLSSLPLPSPFTEQNSDFFFRIRSLGQYSFIGQGKNEHFLQRQINVVDSLTVQKGLHNLKFGVDFRRLSPLFDSPEYGQQLRFNTVPLAENGNLSFAFILAARSATLLFRNLGLFAQDTWRVTPRLTLTYGLRWDIDFAPSTLSGSNMLAVTGFNLSDLSSLAPAPLGTAPYQTKYSDFAPRVGLAYLLSNSPNRQTVFRGGFGVFYDLATSEAGNLISIFSYPFGGEKALGNRPFPLSASDAAPPSITAASLSSGELFAMDPNLELPYTLEWNASLEQSIGRQQTLSASYLGAVGRRLLQTAIVTAPNPNVGTAVLTTNAGTGDYHALQLQFQRRLSRGLQVLASYTWAHSIDTASAGSPGNASNALIPSMLAGSNRGASDFDIRHAFSAGVTYDLPGPASNPFMRGFLRGWSVDNIVQARSAPPVDVSDANNFFQFNGGFFSGPI